MKKLIKKIFSGKSTETKEDIKASKDDNSKSICPYCKIELEQKPSRKKKCTSCEKYIYLRTSPSTRKKLLVTEDEAKDIDIEWEKQYLINKWKDTFQQYGITEKEYENYREELRKKWEREPNERDIAWSIFNKLLFLKHRDLHDLQMIYYQMALFLNEEGKDFFKILQQSSKTELLKMKKEGYIEKVKIMASDDSCESCKKLNDKLLFIDEAIEKLPIPCEECSHIMDSGKRGFCRCLYNAEIEV